MTDIHKHILIHLSVSGNCVGIRTYSKAHGRHGRFLIVRDMLAKCLDGRKHARFIDTDCGHFLRMNIDGDMCHITVSWLSVSYGQISGIEQSFDLPLRKLTDAVLHEQECKHVHIPAESSSKIELHCSHEKFARIIRNKHIRRAFSKAMRDCFHYCGNPTVRLYPDGASGFSFEVDDDLHLCGGLILHNSTKRIRNREYPRVLFSIHT